MMRDYSPSESSEYYLPREEFLTVLHFARSYPEWKQTLSIRPGVTAMRYDEDKVQTSPKCDSLEKIAIRRVELSKRCKLIEDTVHDVGDDIYDYLDINDNNLKENLKAKEIELELASCYANKKIKKFYDRAIENGNEVIIISDMYLPQEVIQAMLGQCGIYRYKKLYVSNSFNANKITGKLFEIAISELGVPKKNIVHLGDSIKADFLGAHKAGIKAVLVHRKNRLRRFL